MFKNQNLPKIVFFIIGLVLKRWHGKILGALLPGKIGDFRLIFLFDKITLNIIFISFR